MSEYCVNCEAGARRIAELETTLNATNKLYESRGAYIAELEAEVQHQVERREEEKLRAVNAEAALAEREGRRCEACQRAYTDCSRRIVLVNDDTVDVDSCSEWTARAEEWKP